MNRLTAALIAAATIALTRLASAADLPRKAPAYAPPPPPVHSWTGFYVGGNVGAAWAKDDITWDANAAGFGGGPFLAALNAAGAGSLDPVGVIAGGQIGFNYQINSFILGAEADFNYTDLSETRSVAVAPPAALGTVVTSTFESKWLATVRGRLGFLATPNLLLYGTGGVAFAEVKTADSVFFTFDGSSNAASNSETKTGWTAGGGVEWAFSPNWSAKVEYLFVDLGSVNYTSPNTGTPLATINHEHSITENIVRVGLNYKFGGPY
jgi:outer membrane immunogenic protein